MTMLTKRTVKMMAATVEVAKTELPIEAQKLREVYKDPEVSQEAKAFAIKEVDRLIDRLEKKVETERTTRKEIH